jgi:hypothetical protein
MKGASLWFHYTDYWKCDNEGLTSLDKLSNTASVKLSQINLFHKQPIAQISEYKV